MNFYSLITRVTDKKQFQTIEHYIDFCYHYLEYIDTQLQARIISQNEIQYQFLQYKAEGNFNITRPLNSSLMYDTKNFTEAAQKFKMIFEQLRDRETPSDQCRENLTRTIYTLQQSIGAALDGLPSGKTNQARKINGDLFERLIRLIIASLNIDCISGTVQVPVKNCDNIALFKASYQHDLLLKKHNKLKVIGSVKTSSKDRIDKVFMDKFLYNRLTDTAIPHIAIFLNDVQRKKSSQENIYGISATFLPGRFKAFTIKLNPLDGVYYCDIRPNMISDTLLSQHIKTIDHFFYSDVWELINREDSNQEEIIIK